MRRLAVSGLASAYAGEMPGTRQDGEAEDSAALAGAVSEQAVSNAARIVTDRHVCFTVDANVILLALPLVGGASTSVEEGARPLTPAVAGLFCREGAGAITLEGGARVLLLPIGRSAVQAHASMSHGAARRIARAGFSIALDSDLARLVAQQGWRRERDAGLDARIVTGLVAALVGGHGLETAFPRSRSVSLARAQLDEGAARGWNLRDLASNAGVTPVTLQRGFRTCLGTTVAGYAQIVCMREAQARLGSACETRSLAAIAQGFGYASARSFTRAYEKAFGETPTQTRSRAVKFGMATHRASFS